MAITPAAFTSGIQAGAASATTASKTWASGKLYVIKVMSFISGGTPAAPTVTGATSIISHSVSLATTVRITAFRFMGDGSTGIKTIDFGGVSQDQIQWTVSELDGIDTGGTNGSAAIVQSTASEGNSTTLSDTLSAFGDAVNNAAFVFGWSAGGNALTEEAGYTALSSQSSFFTLLDAAKVGEDTSPTMTQSGSSVWSFIALEIKAASSTTPPTPGFSTSVDRKQVTVTDTSVAGTNPITNVTYDFGDGSGSTASTSHTYAVGGTYTITQTVVASDSSPTTTHDVTTKTRYRYRVQTVGGRSATTTADRPDA